MKDCDSCFFFDNCSDFDKSSGRCEYYYPLFDESVAMREFEDDLRMREEEYRKVVEEQQS